MERITAVVGAGAILDFDMPDGCVMPSTGNITDVVVKHKYVNSISHKDSHVIKKIYKLLEKDDARISLNFEELFFILENLYTYGNRWHKNMCTSSLNPKWGYFIKPRLKYDDEEVRAIMTEYIAIIMDMINAYNEQFIKDKKSNVWYREFWQYEGRLDVFNFNYDSTVEESLKDYTDGYQKVSEQSFLQFNPTLFYNKSRNSNTVCHLHGSILFGVNDYKVDDFNQIATRYNISDLFKYKTYQESKYQYDKCFISSPTNQANETLFWSPIITGLRKTDKLSILPLDFYHCFLTERIIKNRSMLIVGFSFGDAYVVDMLNRYDLIHGSKKRVVLIDKWNVVLEKYNPVDDYGPSCKDLMREYIWNTECNEMSAFICRMANVSMMERFVDSVKVDNPYQPIYSKNGCLMLFIAGMKEASKYKNEIYRFLNS